MSRASLSHSAALKGLILRSSYIQLLWEAREDDGVSLQKNVHAQSHLTLGPCGLQPTRLLCLWVSPGKNPGVGFHFLLQAILLTQGSTPGLLHWQVDSLPLSHQGSATNNSVVYKMQMPQTSGLCLELHTCMASLHGRHFTHNGVKAEFLGYMHCLPGCVLRCFRHVPLFVTL